MDFLIMAGQLILGLSILVGLHELGHLLAAKAFGMRVEKFSIGFPPTIFKVQWGETEYGIGAIPLGGYVKIAGMIDESMDKEFLNKEPEPWEFRSKPAWQRLIVMMGGIIVNVVTGIIIFILLTYARGEEYIPAEKAKYGIVAREIAQEELNLQTGDQIIAINGESFERFNDIRSAEVLLGTDAYYTVRRGDKTFDQKIPNNLMDKLADNREGFIDDIPVTKDFAIEEVVPDSPADKAGLQKGDKIIRVESSPSSSKLKAGLQANGQGTQAGNITYYHELQAALQENADKEVNVIVQRGNKQVKKTLQVTKEGKIGFAPSFVKTLYVHNDFTLAESIPKGTTNAFSIIVDNIRGFGKIFRGEVSASKSLSGPIGIGQIYGAVWIWSKFWFITGMLSMILAFMNFLPIPALDGGHVMFLTYEIVSGNKPSDKFLEVSQKVGMLLILCLMAFAILNDFIKLL
ncbi:MAG: RIP metalloprotease RseP [Thermonemataceae bacterium]